MENQKAATPQKSERYLRMRVYILLVLFGIVIFVPLGVKLYTIQITRHDELEQMAFDQQTASTKVTANRGSIYDRNMNVLASSGSAETVGIDPSNIESDEQAALIAQGLSEILALDYDWVYEKTTHRGTRNMTIAIKIDTETANEVRAFIAKNKLHLTIKLEADSKRFYTYSNMASQVLGFVGRDNKGLDGLEAYYDSLLTGTPGYTVTLGDSKAHIMPNQYEMFYDAQDGDGLILTLDETVQHFLDKHLEEAMLKYDVQNRGCGIVMDVNTGAILAMSSKGDYDPNNYQEITDAFTLSYLQELLDSGADEEAYNKAVSEARLEQWRNKAVSDPYEPGSTFKIITSAMAVEDSAFDLNAKLFTCSGIVHNVGGFDIRCHKRTGHGSQTLAEAIQNSCNPAFISIAAKIGPESFYNYMTNFGLFEKTGIDMQGEASNAGLYHSRDTYLKQISTQATYSFGQTFKVTALQMITAVSAVANGGYLMQPYIVSEIVDQNGLRAAVNSPTVVRQVVSGNTSVIMREYLEDAVKLGTGKNAYVRGYRIAGKTGTSQKRDLRDEEGNDISDGKYVVSFVGFAPADDPQIAVLIMFDEPGGERATRSGGQMAAPVAGAVFEDILPYLGIAPHYSGEELAAAEVKVPDFLGKTVEEVDDALKGQSIGYRVIGNGTAVMDQVPKAGTMLPGTADILIYTEGEAERGMVVMPDVRGMTPEKVNTTLGNLGLFMQVTGAMENSGDVTAGDQEFAPGEEVPFGTVVKIQFYDEDVSDFGRVSASN